MEATRAFMNWQGERKPFALVQCAEVFPSLFLKLPHKEPRHVVAHGCVGIIPFVVFDAVMENALDLERVKLGLEGRAEARMMDPLPRLGVGGKWCIRLGVKKDRRRVAGRYVVER